VDGRGIVLMGHGEGGLVALAAARAVRPAALILLETPAKPVHEIVAEQFLRDARAADPQAAAQWPAVLGGSLRSFRDQLSEAAEGASVDYAGLPLPPAAVRYIKSLYDVRPAALAAGLRVPALVVQGSRDAVVGRENGAILALALPRGDLRVIDGMTHGLTLDGGTSGAGAPVIPAATPLHPVLIWTLLSWLRRVVPQRGRETDRAEARDGLAPRRAGGPAAGRAGVAFDEQPEDVGRGGPRRG
jgi:pimeloyl-ACP methyl ester carboxylesterase